MMLSKKFLNQQDIRSLKNDTTSGSTVPVLNFGRNFLEKTLEDLYQNQHFMPNIFAVLSLFGADEQVRLFLKKPQMI